ncbi:MAG: hypothetical protein K6U09_02655 [Acidobacteriia bacterium]|jgi:hypothetical protein|nr:hypothetical protein [Terriglobia bacterium]
MSEADVAVTPASAPPPKPAEAVAGAEAETPRYKIKTKKPRQRSCDEPDPKGNLPAKNKLCCGHLKRWYDYPPEVERLVGKGAELYRCEICRTLYRPDPHERPRSYTHRF